VTNSDETSQPLVIAHRGDWRNDPQNSAAALTAAVTSGADWAEIDLRSTADGVLVLSHDATAGGLQVASTALDALRRAHPPLTTLDEAFEAADGLGGLDLEIKAPIASPGAFFETLAAALRAWKGAVLVSSFFVPILQNAKATLDEVDLGVLTASSYDPDGRVALESSSEVGGSVIVPEHPSVSEGLIDEAHRAGKRAIAWTVSEADQIRALLRWGIDGIITDNVPLARRLAGS
jgi:glycerophosphoryl diester phosphodiesterase